MSPAEMRRARSSEPRARRSSRPRKNWTLPADNLPNPRLGSRRAVRSAPSCGPPGPGDCSWSSLGPRSRRPTRPDLNSLRLSYRRSGVAQSTQPSPASSVDRGRSPARSVADCHRTGTPANVAERSVPAIATLRRREHRQRVVTPRSSWIELVELPSGPEVAPRQRTSSSASTRFPLCVWTPRPN